MHIVDPMYYHDRLARIPKAVVLSSDDEFMSMDWSNIWYDDLKGEKHLLIAPDSEHSLFTGIPEVLTCLGNMIKSLAQEQTTRPNFEYVYDQYNGQITVKIPAGVAVPRRVTLRYAQTISDKRRDFRWVRAKNNFTGPCHLPEFPAGKDMCVQPLIWLGRNLTETAPGSRTWTVLPPAPIKGHWMGYYVEIFWPSQTELLSDFQFTTPGFTWPTSLPYPECHAEGCLPRLV